MKAQKQKSIEEMALDLLDFCGGSQPTWKDLRNWIRLRNLKDVNSNLIMQTAESFLTNP